MKKIILVSILAGIASITNIFAQNATDYVTEAYVMANIQSVYANGAVKCEVVAYYVPGTNVSELHFQLGSTEDPTAYVDQIIHLDNLDGAEALLSYEQSGSIIKLNFGEIYMQRDFAARLLFEDNGMLMAYDLGLTGYGNTVTSMK